MSPRPNGRGGWDLDDADAQEVAVASGWVAPPIDLAAFAKVAADALAVIDSDSASAYVPRRHRDADRERITADLHVLQAAHEDRDGCAAVEALLAYATANLRRTAALYGVRR